MTKKEIKLNMKKRAQMAAGMVNLLKDDVTYLQADVNDLDILCMEESLKDTKATIQMLTDNITEIEYMLYLLNSREAN